jgi:uncharacterized protein (TIGR03435 family)
VAIRTLLFFATIFVSALHAQSAAAASQAASSPTPEWQIAAGGTMAFDVASVKQNKSGLRPSGNNSNVPLGPGDYYSPNGGLFRTTNMPLLAYMTFAYKATGNQVRILHDQVPKWVLSDRFDIEARAVANPTKDQMRLMMQALLADRFKLAVHRETRELLVFGLVPVKPGKLGPQLQVHSEEAPCSTDPQTSFGRDPVRAFATVAGGFPATCGGIQPMAPTTPGNRRLGGRNIPVEMIATTLSDQATGLDRPILDQTGLNGEFDFTIEFKPDSPLPPGSNSQVDESGPTFLEALKEQLGLKLEPQTGSVDVLVLDHIEQPSEN